jgi:hypothetical protein
VQALNGMQIGFVNYVDSIDNGIPIGFISIVRQGGYRAVEYSFSEYYPVTVGLKLGVERFYTTISAAYKPSGEFAPEDFALGFGIGSIFPIGSLFFLNPEINYLTPSAFSWNDSNVYLHSFVPSFGIKLSKFFSITAGPSVTWVHRWWWGSGDDEALPKPLFSIADHSINERNSIVVGARVAGRLHF